MPKFQTQKIPTSYRVHRRHLNLKQAQSISLREETNIPIRFVKNQLLFTPFSRHFSTRLRCYIITANIPYFEAGLLLRSLEYLCEYISDRVVHSDFFIIFHVCFILPASGNLWLCDVTQAYQVSFSLLPTVWR